MPSDAEGVLAAYREASAALHELWSDHAGEPGYIKSKWMRLSNALDRLDEQDRIIEQVRVHLRDLTVYVSRDKPDVCVEDHDPGDEDRVAR